MFLLISVAILMLAYAFRAFHLKILSDKDRNIQRLTTQLAAEQMVSFHQKNEVNAILSSMVEGVVVIGRDERILYVSPNAADMFQMRSKDVAQKPYWEVIPHQQINQSIKEALRGERMASKEITLIGAKDNYFSMQISPVLQEGQLASAVAVFHDITEYKRLLKMRSEFVANVSHELKTPLTSIKGFVETLREDRDLNDQARRFLEIIHKQTNRLEMLVNDLLTLSAIESKEEKMDMVPEEIGPIVLSVIGMYRKASQTNGLTLDVDVASGLPRVSANRHRLEQVLINLVDNAVKFTPSGGFVGVKVFLEAPFVRVDVSDSGIGIPAEHLPRVFERFYRVDKARSRESGGTGLGLAIVKHIVQAHHGKIEVESTPGKGSTFSVFLPTL